MPDLSPSKIKFSGGFHFGDRNALAIFDGDWNPFASKWREEISHFQQANNFILQGFLYSAVHGKQSKKLDAIDFFVRHVFQVIPDSRYVVLEQVHYATTLYPRTGEAIFASHEAVARLKDVRSRYCKADYNPDFFCKRHGSVR